MRHQFATARGLAPAAIAALLLAAAAPGRAQTTSRVVPVNTVVKAQLDQELNSKTAAIGQRFTASLAADDQSGFPVGTKFEGLVTESRVRTETRPGVLGMEFKQAILPGGTRVAISGQLASLSDEDLRRTSTGRVEARTKSDGKKFDLKWVGYGAAAGAVLGELLGSNFLKGALLGGLGGAVYGYLNRDKGDSEKLRNVKLPKGQEFGIRMDQRVAFTDRSTYRYAGGADTGDGGRVAGARQEFRYDIPEVTFDRRPMRFDGQEPLHLNGILYIPLESVAREAGFTFTHRRGDEDFKLVTSRETIAGRLGQIDFRGRNGVYRVDSAPIAINGEIFVTTEFLSQVADLGVSYDRSANRVDLTR